MDSAEDGRLDLSMSDRCVSCGAKEPSMIHRTDSSNPHIANAAHAFVEGPSWRDLRTALAICHRQIIEISDERDAAVSARQEAERAAETYRLCHDTEQVGRIAAESRLVELREEHERVCSCPFDGTDPDCNLAGGQWLGATLARTREPAGEGAE